MPFSSSSYRFESAPGGSNENPGPGAYYSEEDRIEVILEGENINKASHYFKSNSKRAVFGNRA